MVTPHPLKPSSGEWIPFVNCIPPGSSENDNQKGCRDQNGGHQPTGSPPSTGSYGIITCKPACPPPPTTIST